MFGLGYCLMPCDRRNAVASATAAWLGTGNELITLSVRSGFDLVLRSLQLPAGSEVLLSALTVPDMVRIVEAHGLIPIPVDVDECGNVSLDSLRNAISTKTRILVVAHLWGGRQLLDDITEIIKPHNILLVEDCAQCFDLVGDAGHPASDFVMHSFGPIKTATALGGAIIQVRDGELQRQMKIILSSDPVQSRFTFAQRVIRFALLKALSGRLMFSFAKNILTSLGKDYDQVLNTMGQGFQASDDMNRFRLQPSVPLLRLLERRWRTYDFSRIDRRKEMGRRLDGVSGQQHNEKDSHWVYPIFIDQPEEVRDQLRAAGFDATTRSRMIVVPAVDESRLAISAEHHWKRILFLPWYPELNDAAFERMGSVLTE